MNRARGMLLAVLVTAACDQDASMRFRDASVERGAADPRGWAIAMGGPGADDLPLLALDAPREELVVAGRFSGSGRYGGVTVSTGRAGLFIARFNISGQVRWVLPVQATLSPLEIPRLAVDDDGNAYLAAGGFSGSAAAGAIRVEATGPADLLVLKVDRHGTPLWCVPHGGPGNVPSQGTRIVSLAARADVVLVAGSFSGAMDLSEAHLSSSDEEIFLARLDRADGRAAWAVKAGSAGPDFPSGLTLDAAGNGIVAGVLGHGKAVFGELAVASQNPSYLFLAKIDSFGRWLWARTTSGPGKKAIGGNLVGLMRDAEGNIYGTGALIPGYAPLVAKLDPAGEPVWASAAKGPDATVVDGARGLALDHGRLHVLGTFSGTRWFGEKEQLTARVKDIFFSTLDAATGTFVRTRQLGGVGEDWGTMLAIDAAGNLYGGGHFSREASFADTLLTSEGDSDLVLWKIPAAEH